MFESVFCKIRFCKLPVGLRLLVWTKLEVSEHSENISSLGNFNHELEFLDTSGVGGGYEDLKYTSDFAISYKPKREMVLGLQLLSCVLKFQLRCYTRKFRLIQTWRTASF